MLTRFRNDERLRSAGGRRRGGLTTLEFVGCATAVLGGAWIGALYYGVDMQHVAYSALQHTQLLEKVPPEWRPEGPKQNIATQEQLTSNLRSELGSLRNEITALRSETDASSAPEANSDTAIAARNSTQVYWLQLNEISLGESDLQRDAEKKIDDANAAKVFAIKARVSRFAANGIEAIPSEGVDEAVLAFGRQLALWYGRGDKLYERAVQILETPTGQQARAQLTEEWKQDETQHRQEASLIRERAATLRATISRQHGEEFPEFAKPVAPAPPAPSAETSVTTG